MQSLILPEPCLSHARNNVFSHDFICSSITKQFKARGFKVQDKLCVNTLGKQSRMIMASTFFKKEVVEIKGCSIDPAGEPEALSFFNLQKKISTKHSLSDSIFSSVVGFSGYYRGAKPTISIAVPDVPKFRSIIDLLQGYFTSNDLYFKMYLVNENGGVEVFYLNEQGDKK